MKRMQMPAIAEDLHQKMVFLAGPRQAGKTTLAKTLGEGFKSYQYLNFDAETDRLTILRQEWNRQTDLIVLDELHKLKGWKRRIKGVFDTEGNRPKILVTGSARMDVYRKGGDSLAGRYFLHRLYPLSVKEAGGRPQEALAALMTLGGFPEPFLGGKAEAAARWRKQHLERIVREDVRDLAPVRDIQTLLILIDLLRERVGSTLSYASLASDLSISPHTVKSWIKTLEDLYVIFLVSPYHRNLARAIQKEPKVYFYDTGSVRGDEGARFENTVALCLRKWLHFLEDTKGETWHLHFLRDREKREVDFVLIKNQKVYGLIEVKFSEDNLSPALAYYRDRLQPEEAVQLVCNLKRAKTVEGIHITAAAEWLSARDI